jgi:ribosomal protein S18 acetylase RimI-like enzyme
MSILTCRLEPYDGHPVCYLYEVMVADPFRHLGIGSHLMKAVEVMVRGLGQKLMMMEVVEVMVRGLGQKLMMMEVVEVMVMVIGL